MNDDDKRPEDEGQEPEEAPLPPPENEQEGFVQGGPVPEHIPPPPPRPEEAQADPLQTPDPVPAPMPEHESRSQFPELAPIGDEYNPPQSPPPPSTPQEPGETVPGKVSALAIMFLVGGIVSIFAGFAIAAAFVCLYPIYIYQFVFGVMSIVHGAKMLGDKNVPPSRALPIMMIICILGCDFVNLVLGILTMIFSNDPEVRSWYAARGIGY